MRGELSRTNLFNPQSPYRSYGLDDLHKTWSATNEILYKKNNESLSPYYFTDDDSIITYSLEIANKFNEFFTIIRPNLANKIFNEGAKTY